MEAIKILDNEEIPNNLEIFKSFLVTQNKFETNNKILCSVSGGGIVI